VASVVPDAEKEDLGRLLSENAEQSFSFYPALNAFDS
jgi:hypothetical protein